MIIMIAAVAENFALGKDNELVWHLPDDFKRFKQLTTNHYIIMGRKTFESFPKPLPNRTHVIITRQQDYTAEGCLVVANLADALALIPKDENAFVIGGGEIYALALPFTDVIEITKVHARWVIPACKAEGMVCVQPAVVCMAAFVSRMKNCCCHNCKF